MWIRYVVRDECVFVFVDADAYLDTQPIQYEDELKHVIDLIRNLGRPVYAFTDVSHVRLSKLYIRNFVSVIWRAHKETIDDGLLKAFYISGVPPRVWDLIHPCLPRFVSDVIIFSHINKNE